MDRYFDELFSFALETRLAEELRQSEDYRRAVRARGAKSAALEARLTPEQRVLLDDFYSAESDALVMEEKFLFREGLALGKWMAR